MHAAHPQVSDGAAAVLLMTRAEAARRGLPVLGIFRSFAAVGVDPAVMGVGPAVAIPAALAMAGLTTADIDVFELNEAFASQVQAVPCCAPDPIVQLLPPRACACSRRGARPASALLARGLASDTSWQAG